MDFFTHIKSRVELSPEVEPFPYILDNTREQFIFIFRMAVNGINVALPPLI